jgi:hypothetical protein
MINFPTPVADNMACPIYISSPALTKDIVLQNVVYYSSNSTPIVNSIYPP